MLDPQPREDPDWLGVLHECMRQRGSADACWTSRDGEGNTVLHLTALISNAPCVEWILNQKFGPQMLQFPNDRGETPLELLQFRLEKLRTQKDFNTLIVPVSDQFEGHGDNAVRCLILLQEMGSVDSVVEDSLLRLIGGCACGQCLKGFLSPRMLHCLLYQART